MARGFGSTLGAGTTDSVQLASFTMPSKVSVWVRYLKNGTGGSAFGRLFEKPGPSTKEITLAISTTTKMFIERDFSGANGVWEFDDPQANTVGLWADVFFTYDDSSTSNDPLVWVNGRSVTVTRLNAPTGTPVNTSGACYVGNWSAGTRNWDGIISKFAMWSTTGGYPEAKALLAGVDPRNIKPNTLIDFVDLSVPLVISQKYRTAPTVTGTKIRPDQIVITQGRTFPFGALTSGTTYNDTLTQTATATDGVTVTATFAPALTESGTAGDSATVIATFNATLSQGVTATESSIGGSIFNDTLTQGATATDAYAQSVVFGPSLTETVAGGDSYTVIATFAPAYGETATAGFSLSDGSAASIWTTIAPTSGAWGTQSASTGIWTTLPPSTGTWT